MYLHGGIFTITEDTKSHPNPNHNPTTKQHYNSMHLTMTHVSRETHARQCYCTVFTTFCCHCASACSWNDSDIIHQSKYPAANNSGIYFRISEFYLAIRSLYTYIPQTRRRGSMLSSTTLLHPVYSVAIYAALLTARAITEIQSAAKSFWVTKR